MRTDLLSGTFRRRTLVFLALGGGGVRTLEALLHLCALGLGPERLVVVVVESDAADGSLARTLGLLEHYIEARARLVDAGSRDDFFRTEVVAADPDTPVCSPFRDTRGGAGLRLSDVVERAAMERHLGALFDLLHDLGTREMDFTAGFRGNLAAASVVMEGLRTGPVWRRLLGEVVDPYDTLFFAAGSVFGATGAAALPVVARILGHGDVGGGWHPRTVPRDRMGAALLLPYFSLASAPGHSPESPRFTHRVLAEFPRYLRRADQVLYGSYYLLGDSIPREQDGHDPAGPRHASPPHYVELMAALAALDFTARGGEPPDAALPVFRAMGVAGDDVSWRDLPLNDSSRAALRGALLAMHVFLTFFRPDGTPGRNLERALIGVTWAETLGMPPYVWSQNAAVLDALARYWMNTWEWFRDLRRSDPPLRLTGTRTERPTGVVVGDLLEGSAPTRRLHDVYAVFRDWNAEAAWRSGQGFEGFVSMMRAGSERYARRRFSSDGGA